MEKVETGHLSLEQIELKPKKTPLLDRDGNLLVANEMNLIRDYRFDPAESQCRSPESGGRIK